jgi:hypothetical protein
VGKEVKDDGVVRLKNRCGPNKSGVLLKEQTFPIAVPPVTTWCGEYLKAGFQISISVTTGASVAGLMYQEEGKNQDSREIEKANVES